MKLITQDYGCGTSSSILDYGISDVVVVSPGSWEHVLEIEEELLFIGHDFLFFMWDTEDKIKRWEARSSKFEHWVWCFERIDAIVPMWKTKSYASIKNISRFATRILACDEEDCDKFGYDWLPQWASLKFYERKKESPSNKKILFSGQAGKPEYYLRNQLLTGILNDPSLCENFHVSNISRVLSWDDYATNLLMHSTILNPIGVLKALNTRAYETLYSGRLLLQQKNGNYPRHQKLLSKYSNVIFFDTLNDLTDILKNLNQKIYQSEDAFLENSLHARMKSLGVIVK